MTLANTVADVSAPVNSDSHSGRWTKLPVASSSGVSLGEMTEAARKKGEGSGKRRTDFATGNGSKESTPLSSDGLLAEALRQVVDHLARKEKKEASKSKTSKDGKGQGASQPSTDYLFSEALLSGSDNLVGHWAVEAEHTSGGGCVYRWEDNLYWRLVGAEEGESLAAEWLYRKDQARARANSAASAWKFAGHLLRQLRPLPKPTDERVIVPCADVYLEMDSATGKIIAVDPDKSLGITYATRVSAGTRAGQEHVLQALPDDSEFSQWLRRAQPDPGVRAVIQEQCGMTLLPGSYSVAAWWFGVPGAGKSTLSELCESMQRQVARVELERLNDNFALESIVGASLILVDEVEQEKWAEGKFRSLVSGNGVPVSRKFRSALLSYHSPAKWIITSNQPPFVRAKDNGVWRRLCPVEWNVPIPESERRRSFQQQLLRKEGRLILDWMLEGAMRIVKRGRFLSESERPTLIRETKESIRRATDNVLAWIEENEITVDPDQWLPCEKVYEHYMGYCKAQQREPLLMTPFWRAVHSNHALKAAGARTKSKRAAKALYGTAHVNLRLSPPVDVVPVVTIVSKEEVNKIFPNLEAEVDRAITRAAAAGTVPA